MLCGLCVSLVLSRLGSWGVDGCKGREGRNNNEAVSGMTVEER